MFLDINMPGETGLQFAKSLQKENVDFVFGIVATEDSDAVQEEACALGARFILHKPFTTALGNVPTGHFTTTILEVVTEGDLRGAVACASLDDMCVDIILNQLSPMLENEDPRNFERIWQKLFGHLQAHCINS